MAPSSPKISMTLFLGTLLTIIMGTLSVMWYAKADVAAVEANRNDIEKIDCRVTRIETTVNDKLDQILKEVKK